MEHDLYMEREEVGGGGGGGGGRGESKEHIPPMRRGGTAGACVHHDTHLKSKVSLT